jgi:hypothetical protein
VTALTDSSTTAARSPRPAHTAPSHSATIWSPDGDSWPLLAAHRRGWFSTVLDGLVHPARVRQLPGDLLIGLPLSLVGHVVGRNERVRSFADVD